MCSPAGQTVYLWALWSKDVRRLSLQNGKVVDEEVLFSELTSRIRDIRSGPDSFLIITDGSDGKVVRVSPQ